MVSCYVTSGSDDFMVEVAARDLADYERVLLDQILAIPAVTQARTTFAIRTVLSRARCPSLTGTDSLALTLWFRRVTGTKANRRTQPKGSDRGDLRLLGAPRALPYGLERDVLPAPAWAGLQLRTELSSLRAYQGEVASEGPLRSAAPRRHGE